MNPYLSSILGVAVIDLVPFIGIFILLNRVKNIGKISKYLVSFAVGALLGNAFFHLMPELYGGNLLDPYTISVLMITGILIFYILEQYLMWQHCHEENNSHHYHPVTTINIIGHMVHNLLDGMLIASSFILDYRLGIGTVIAVLLHEIPQELGGVGILLYAKWSKEKILLVMIASGLVAFLGLGLGFLIGNSFDLFAQYAVAATAGGFIYIACTDLLPDLHKNGAITVVERLIQLVLMVIGLLVFIIL